MQMVQIKVNSAFDGGSIDVVDISRCDNLQFAIRADRQTHVIFVNLNWLHSTFYDAFQQHSPRI
jgi:hypothetical protein